MTSRKVHTLLLSHLTRLYRADEAYVAGVLLAWGLWGLVLSAGSLSLSTLTA